MCVYSSESDLLLAVGALELLLEPAVDTARVENVLAGELLDLDSRAEHFQTDGATNLLLLSLDLFAFALSKAFLGTAAICSFAL